jgi:hypothetical protein
MKQLALMTFAAALAAPAAWAGAPVFNSANAPNGTHVQSGTPSCSESGYVVTCSTYDLAGVGNADATANLSTTYSGTVLCTNPAGNVAPGQTKYPTLNVSSGRLSPKNGRLTIPSLASTSDTATIEAALMENTKCPNRQWTKSVQPDSVELVGYTYTVTFKGYSGAYLTISG